jgi:branched-chain amino acid transport system substrate-binding protein
LTAAIVGIAATASAVSAAPESTAKLIRAYTPAATGKLTLPLIKVGQIQAWDVPASSHRQTPAVLVASARALNRAGGLHGHPLGVVVCNDKTDPNLALSCARQMVDDGVVAIVGGASFNDNLSQPVLQAANIPMIAAIPISNAAYNGPNVFVPEVPSLVSYKVLALYAHFKGLEPQVPVVADNSGGRSLLADTSATLAQAGGSFAGSPLFINQATVTDFTPFAVAVDQRHPASVFALTNVRAWSSLLQSLASDGTSAKYLLSAPAFALTDIRAIGALGNKVITDQGYPPFNDPRMSGFIKTIKAEQDRGDLNVDPSALSDQDMDPWLGLQILFKVTKGMKNITGANIIDALHRSGPIKAAPFLTWNPQTRGDPNFTSISNTSGYIVGYNNGQQVLLIKHPVNLQQAIAGKF